MAEMWTGSDDVQIEPQTDPWLQVGGEVVNLAPLPGVPGPCDEGEHAVIPGVLHMDGNGPNWIERCDACDLFPGDLHAAQALADHLTTVWAHIHSEPVTVWFHPNT